MRKILYILLLIGFVVNAQNASPYAFCQDGDPIGGGVGYSDILSSVGADIHITSFTTASAFQTTVEGASIGDFIFIDSGVTIDLTGLGDQIELKQDITLASDRGTNTGALIKTDDLRYLGSGSEIPIFYTSGTGVRITGLRIQGPYGDNGSYANPRTKWGISSHWNNTEIDNCELFDFPSGVTGFGQQGSAGFFAPVHQAHSTGHTVHHNYIHNNRQNQWGYGIVVDRAEVTIYANTFQNNRHDIAGGGDQSPNYCAFEAYCNTVLGDNISHNFDMHGNVQDADCDDCPAGKYAYIHHNDFQDDASNRGTNNDEYIRVRGIPEDSATVTFNRFLISKFHTTGTGDAITWNQGDFTGVDQALQQRNLTPGTYPQNIVWSDNTYNGDAPEGGSIPVTGVDVYPTFDKMEATDTRQLYEFIAPATATDQTGTWSSSDDLVATVNSSTGLVTGVGTGSCTITFTPTDQTNTPSDTSTITVEASSTEDSIAILNPQGYYDGTSGDVDSWDDISGFELHGIENGTITFTDEASFDGSSWYSISDPHGFQNYIPQTDSFTLIWREGDTSPTTGYSWSFIGGSGQFQLGGAYSLTVDNFNGLYLGGATEIINPTLNDNRLFIAIVTPTTYDLWVDGDLVIDDSTAIGTELVVSANPNIGGRTDGSYLIQSGGTLDLIATIPKAISAGERAAIEAEFRVNLDPVSDLSTRPAAANGTPVFYNNGRKLLNPN